MKKLLTVVTAVLSLALLASCQITPTGRTEFSPYDTDSLKDSYELTLLTRDDFVSKIYKVVSNDDGKVYYSVSEPNNMGWDDKVNADDLVYFALVSESDMRGAVNFIGEVENELNGRRTTGGVLSDYKISHTKKSRVWNQTTQEWEIVEVVVIDFKIQLKTIDDEERILYTANGDTMEIELSDLQDLRRIILSN